MHSYIDNFTTTDGVMSLLILALAINFLAGPIYVARREIWDDLVKLCRLLWRERVRFRYAKCAWILLMLSAVQSVFDPMAYIYFIGYVAACFAVIWPHPRKLKTSSR